MGADIFSDLIEVLIKNFDPSAIANHPFSVQKNNWREAQGKTESISQLDSINFFYPFLLVNWLLMHQMTCFVVSLLLMSLPRLFIVFVQSITIAFFTFPCQDNSFLVSSKNFNVLVKKKKMVTHYFSDDLPA